MSFLPAAAEQSARRVMKMVCHHYLIVRATVFPPLAMAFIASSSLNGFTHQSLVSDGRAGIYGFYCVL